MTTDWFKSKVPIQFGFLLNDKIVSKLNVSTGDPAKKIVFRFYNPSKIVLTGILLDIRIMRPLSLSGTTTALQGIPRKTIHGKGPGNRYYHIMHSALEMPGDEKFDFGVELNTKGMSPGTYKILVKAYSTERDYKYKESKLKIIMS